MQVVINRSRAKASQAPEHTKAYLAKYSACDCQAAKFSIIVIKFVCVCRNVNRHKRSQSSPLNLPVDIPEASSGDEEAVGSPGARAREHDSLIQEVSHSPCQPTPLGVTQCVMVVDVGAQHWISSTPNSHIAKTACTPVISTMSLSSSLFSCACRSCNDYYRGLIISEIASEKQKIW